MKANLEERIADAITDNLSSGALAALLAEVDDADAAARKTREAASQAALDPATRPAAVAAARKAMEDAEFSSRRLEIAKTKLAELQSEAAARERSDANAVEYAATVAERDQLAADLRKEYPELAARIVGLIERIEANDARIIAANQTRSGPWVRSAEAVARNAPPNWEARADGALLKLSSIRLPRFESVGGNHGYLWPKPI